jgi:hypothetical protein
MMAKFTKIEVHFGVGADARKVVLRPDPDADARAIFLDRSETLLLPAGKFPRELVVKEMPDGLTLERVTPSDSAPSTAASITDAALGPDDVCYLLNGKLHCWAL